VLGSWVLAKAGGQCFPCHPLHSEVSNTLVHIRIVLCQQPTPAAHLHMPWAQPWAWVLGCQGVRELGAGLGRGALLSWPPPGSEVSNSLVHIQTKVVQQPTPAAHLPMPWAQPWAWVVAS
jgi:hypothetical protein